MGGEALRRIKGNQIWDGLGKKRGGGMRATRGSQTRCATRSICGPERVLRRRKKGESGAHLARRSSESKGVPEKNMVNTCDQAANRGRGVKSKILQGEIWTYATISTGVGAGNAEGARRGVNTLRN